MFVTGGAQGQGGPVDFRLREKSIDMANVERPVPPGVVKPPAPPGPPPRGGKRIDPLRIANDIADDLFCIGRKNEATHLVIQTSEMRIGGGWCRLAVSDIALKHIETALRHS